jgi:hypothetical protein
MTPEEDNGVKGSAAVKRGRESLGFHNRHRERRALS